MKLSEIAEVKLGRQRSPKDHDGPNMRKYLRAANVGWIGLLLNDVKQMNFTDAELAQFRLEHGDILLNEASGSPREVGKPAIWQGELDNCAFQNTLLRVRPSDQVDSRYLLHFFRREAESGAFVRGSRGTGINHIGRAALAQWPIPLPPIEEQRRIAAILDHADALRAKRREALARLDELTQSIFIDMFGDPRGAGRRPLGEVAKIQIGPFGSLLHKEDYIAGGIPLVNPMHIVDGAVRADVEFSVDRQKYEELATYHLRPGDVVMGRRGEMGRCAVVDANAGDLLCGTGSLVIRPIQEVSAPGYLGFALSSSSVKRGLEDASLGATMPNLNRAIVESFEVVVPHYGAQILFEDRVRNLRAQKVQHRTALDELDALFVSLQSRAFRGEL
ncbi:restriction endonuclease subunit S [Rhodococcus maanshanensis]|uniref:restriction endonuclease subunit S n=1 Tax=Rhodococcus maanshanensis TaxID=183556 RepID=UPI001FED8E12|nr:restriction endonuclease subunit S [Rhodococcus maanshanensis]